MTARFNPPPFWQQYLPANFQPSSDWIPDVAWGAPPAGWAMWVDTETGYPAAPPDEYRNNAYLYLSVMPGMPDQSVPSEALPAHAMSGAEAPIQFSMPTNSASAFQPDGGKKPMAKGLKITLVVAGIIVFGSIIGSCGGGGDKTSPPASTPSANATEAPAGAATSEAPIAKPAESTVDAAAEASAKSEAEASAKAEAKAEASAKAEQEAKAKEEAEANAKAEAEASAKAEAEEGTFSQQNALESAENYLQFTAFSRSGLISQLKFEDYSTKDATWAVEHVTVDWNEQAAKSAENYLEFTSFSRKGLIDQLVFEGFSRKQAEYGVSQTGL